MIARLVSCPRYCQSLLEQALGVQSTRAGMARARGSVSSPATQEDRPKVKHSPGIGLRMAIRRHFPLTSDASKERLDLLAGSLHSVRAVCV